MYAKHGNYVDADASCGKPGKASTKHLESRLEVTQVTHFGITEKPTRECLLLHNIVGFTVGNFERKV